MTGVKPFVTDSRNLLLIRPLGAQPTQEFLTTLLNSLKRGMQFVYQVEEQEVAAELIGRGEHQRLVFWEAAEGGTGISERLAEEPDAVAMVARRALQVCHFDPDSTVGPDGPAHSCVAACYECLLSYANQPDHRLLDRRLVEGFLRELTTSQLEPATQARQRDAQYEWLRSITDPRSGLEVPFLTFLYENGYLLPDAAQNRPCPDVPAQPDFYYEREGVPGVCIFLDGRGHEVPEQQGRDAAIRQALTEHGYRVIAVRYEDDPADVVRQHPDVFGGG